MRSTVALLLLLSACQPFGVYDHEFGCEDDPQCAADWFCHEPSATCKPALVPTPCSSDAQCSPPCTVCAIGEGAKDGVCGYLLSALDEESCADVPPIYCDAAHPCPGKGLQCEERGVCVAGP